MEESLQEGMKKARVKHQAAGRSEQLGVALLRLGAGGAAGPGMGGTPVTIDKLEGCFDILETAAITGKKSWIKFSKPIPP